MSSSKKRGAGGNGNGNGSGSSGPHRQQSRPFLKEEKTLKPDHGWRAAPGHQICVIDRGSLRFEFPHGWANEPGPTSIKLRDKPHPDDNMILEVSCLKAPRMDWRKVTLDQLLLDSQRGQGRLMTAADIRHIEIPGVVIVWTEYRDIDRVLNREAVWRMAHCRQSDYIPVTMTLLGVFTFGFWPEEQERADAIWDHTLQSIVMGEKIDDPLQGPRYH